MGALVTFSGGIIASGLQAALTRLMHPEIVEMKQFWSRLAVAVIGTAFYITAMVCGILGHIEKSGNTSVPYSIVPLIGLQLHII